MGAAKGGGVYFWATGKQAVASLWPPPAVGLAPLAQGQLGRIDLKWTATFWGGSGDSVALKSSGHSRP